MGRQFQFKIIEHHPPTYVKNARSTHGIAIEKNVRHGCDELREDAMGTALSTPAMDISKGNGSATRPKPAHWDRAAKQVASIKTVMMAVMKVCWTKRLRRGF